MSIKTSFENAVAEAGPEKPSHAQENTFGKVGGGMSPAGTTFGSGPVTTFSVPKGSKVSIHGGIDTEK